MSFDEIKQRIHRYCAYQERCHREVKNKLFELGAPQEQADELIAELITGGFLNEERFARAFAGGKFRMKRWGKLKIVRELEARGLTANCIKAGISEIPDHDYEDTLEGLLRRKSEQVHASNPFVKKDKLAGYALQKGFEPDLIWSILKRQDFP